MEIKFDAGNEVVTYKNLSTIFFNKIYTFAKEERKKNKAKRLKVLEQRIKKRK